MKPNNRSLLSAALLAAFVTFATPRASAASPLDVARQLNEAFVQVADDVSGAVVVISVAKKFEHPQVDGSNPLLDLIPELRRRFEGRKSPPQRFEVPSSEGSGVVISEDGYILTNAHVVEDAEKITVRLKDRRTYPATVRGFDKQSDIAVIKVDAKGLKPAKMGDSNRARVGEMVVAIGAPFELDYTVTFGHISAKGRRVFSDFVMMDQDFLQTDAAINPGNSGGPLVNLNSEVIGINTLIRGMNTGIGFAVPISLARQVADRLIADGKFTRVWLGVGIRSLSEFNDFKDMAGDVKEGVVISSIEKDGPASKSDLKPGDIVVSVDGRSVASAQDLKNEIRVKELGKQVTLDVVRDGKKLKIKVAPGEFPDDREKQVASARSPGTSSGLGLKVKALTPDLAEQFGLEKSSGVVVVEVDPGSPAERKGIQPGDVITRVNRRPIATLKDFKDAIKDADLKKGVAISLVGEEGHRFEIIKDSGE
jgi:Do/DeqQ family serine protease